MNSSSTALAHPNIALIKYWGNRDNTLRIPANGSISMNLSDLETRTRVSWNPDPGQVSDSLTINANPVTGPAFQRVTAFLDLIRNLAGIQAGAIVSSVSNFPLGAGIASSASAFAALALAATDSIGIHLSERDLSRLARNGSGSACRSIPSGFVEWLPGTGDQDSYAVSIAPPNHWDLVDCVAILARNHKTTGSTEGHALASTSPLQPARIADAPRRLELCRQAILSRDFEALASIVELDSNLMHAVMQTSNPALLYWVPETVSIIHQVRSWRKQGLPAFTTIDAGPNVHVICDSGSSDKVADHLTNINGVLSVIQAVVGSGTRLLPEAE